MDSGLHAVLGGRDTRWYKGFYLKLTIVLLVPLISSATNGYDGSMMNGLQALSVWQETFNHPTGGTLGLFNAIQNIGSIAGLPFAPTVSDRFGRRAGILLGAVLMVGGTAIQSAAHNMGMFIAARALIGMGTSFAAIAAPVLISELSFPTHRAPLTSLYNASWYLGSILSALTVFGTFRINNNWSWRIPSLLQGVVPLIQLATVWFVPESPRWLVAHGQERKAADIIAKWHCGGDHSDPLVAWEMAEIKALLELEKEAEGTGWKDLFTGKGNLRRLRIMIPLAFFSQWSGNGLVSYYLTMILSSIGITSTDIQTLINLILQIYNYFWAVVGALAIDRTGRRFLFLTSTGGMCVAFVCWTICSAIYAQSGTEFDPACLAANNGDSSNCVALNANKQAGHAVIAFIFLFYAFYDIAMTPLLISYPVEILPYRLRSKGLMLVNLSVSASLVFNQYVNPIALEAIHWKYYIGMLKNIPNLYADVLCLLCLPRVRVCLLLLLRSRDARRRRPPAPRGDCPYLRRPGLLWLPEASCRAPACHRRGWRHVVPRRGDRGRQEGRGRLVQLCRDDACPPDREARPRVSAHLNLKLKKGFNSFLVVFCSLQRDSTFHAAFVTPNNTEAMGGLALRRHEG